MKELIEQIERKNNELEIIKTKIGFPLLYSHAQTETELLLLNKSINGFRNTSRPANSNSKSKRVNHRPTRRIYKNNRKIRTA
ncbi:hypothetical protein FLGE108171_05575 [Flavobacterium gelidilacus]|jgi:hypothetical protein|uniref:hypothetical protein n=1 Tax=Flavobacterium gelidilacus TaxID=206041 RepID=UPI000407E500|nr:hypothetical protein [Flavobacterium gelidilacus]